MHLKVRYNKAINYNEESNIQLLRKKMKYLSERYETQYNEMMKENRKHTEK